MQKHAFDTKKYQTVFCALPIEASSAFCYDKNLVTLPYAESFSTLHYHDRYEIGICEVGEGLFFSDGCFYTVSKGDVIFVPPNVHHYSRSLNCDQPCYCRFLYVRSDAIEALLPKTEQLADIINRVPTTVRSKEYPSAACQLADIMALCTEQIQYKEEILLYRLAGFLLEGSRWFKSDGGMQQNTRDAYNTPYMQASEIARYLALHYFETKTVEELAKMCHLSASQLRRQFDRAYGMSPVEYRNDLRCRIACELLLRTTLSVYEIALKLGYTTPSDLYRCFQKKYGLSPSEYRKRRLPQPIR